MLIHILHEFEQIGDITFASEHGYLLKQRVVEQRMKRLEEINQSIEKLQNELQRHTNFYDSLPSKKQLRQNSNRLLSAETAKSDPIYMLTNSNLKVVSNTSISPAADTDILKEMTYSSIK
jgi:conjugal transfer/entry exclusion protein